MRAGPTSHLPPPSIRQKEDRDYTDIRACRRSLSPSQENQTPFGRGHIPRRSSRSRSRYRIRPPTINDSDKGRIAKFADEIEGALEMRPEFARPLHRELETTARLLRSYGILSIEQIRNTGKQSPPA